MALGFSATLRNNIADAILADIDAGATAATLKIYDGVQPATGGAATNLLATFTLTDPAGTVSGNVLTLDFDPDLSTTWSGSGTATWFRIETGTAAAQVIDGTVTVSSGGGDLELSSVTADGVSTVTLETGTITVGNA